MLAHGARSLAVAVAFAASLPAPAQQVVKLAYIDPLSGAFATTGDHALKHFQFAAEEVNKRGSA
ncbi:MAG TPA: branched-chain amino acid ABC transporter substrate-binding protein, partial [Burkholderiales bacterium]|nr:branched-chain amino acid ABC transporter substrate-binding protein [Burkholderiales bacterium]